MAGWCLVEPDGGGPRRSGGNPGGRRHQDVSIDLPDTIDLLLLDGAKSLYPEILSLVGSRLKPDALIVADNADYCPEYLERGRSPDGGYMSTPFAEDVEPTLSHLTRTFPNDGPT